jgi:cell division protein ZapA
MHQSVEVEIMGQHLTVASDDGEQHVREVAAFVDEQMRRLAGGRPVPSALHLALLAALNIASEYWKLQREQEDMQRTINRVSKRVLSRLR